MSESAVVYFDRRDDLEQSLKYRLTCLGLLVWWIFTLYPFMAVRSIEEGDAALATAQGNVANQILVILFATLGALNLPRAVRELRRHPELKLISYPLGAYLLWSALTILWSDDAALSIRRLGQLILLIVGATGLGAGFYASSREKTLLLARHVLFASWVAIAMLFISRLADQSIVELFDPSWNLKGNTAEQFYIYPIAFGIVAAQFLYRNSRLKKAACLSLLVLVLLLLKGRTMILGTVAVVLFTEVPFSTRVVTRGAAVVGGGFLSLVQLDLATGNQILNSCVNWIAASSLLPYVTLGNGVDDLLSLDGRVPLWQILWRYFQQHPLIGYGFGAFWNPIHLDDIYSEVTWHAVVAHNGFFDELLGTGIIGLVLFLLFWCAAMRFSLREARHDKAAGYLVFGWLLMFLSFNSAGSIMQSYFQSPTLFCLVALSALIAQSSRPEYRILGSKILRQAR